MFTACFSWISSIFTLAIFKSLKEDNMFVKGLCKGISCNCSFSSVVKQQFMSTGAAGNIPALELLCTNVDNAYNVLYVEYLLHLGGKYNFPLCCSQLKFSVPHNTVNSYIVGVVNNHSLLKCKGIQ